MYAAVWLPSVFGFGDYLGTCRVMFCLPDSLLLLPDFQKPGKEGHKLGMPRIVGERNESQRKCSGVTMADKDLVFKRERRNCNTALPDSAIILGNMALQNDTSFVT